MKRFLFTFFTHNATNQDEAAMDLEVDQALAKIATERAGLERELEALSNELRAAYAKAVMGGTAEGEEGEGGDGPVSETPGDEAAAVVTSMDVASEGVGGKKETGLAAAAGGKSTR